MIYIISAGRPMDDMFKPFANQFFDAFFHDTGDLSSSGLAVRLSKEGHDKLKADIGSCVWMYML